MGAELTDTDTDMVASAGRRPASAAGATADLSSVPWLDTQTAGLVRAIIGAVASRQPGLRAGVLFGSVARHDERPLSEPRPSDVDLLLVFDLEPALDRLPYERLVAIFEAVGSARDQYLATPREVQVILAVRDLEGWDPLFVRNVVHDGLVLWQRGSLPEVLKRLPERHVPCSDAGNGADVEKTGAGAR